MRQFNELLYFNKMMLSHYCVYFTLVFVLFSFQTSGSCSSISNICFVNILYNQSVSLEVIVCYTEEDYFILLVHVSTILYIVILLFK